MAGMDALVTGCMGTIGRPLCLALRKAGFTVYGWDLEHPREEFSPFLDGYARVDIGLATEVQQAQEAMHLDPEFVFNLAAEFGRKNGDHHNERMWRSNVLGLRNLISAFGHGDGEGIIQASSSEVYGDVPNGFCDEDLFDTLALQPHNDYALSKYTGEKMILNSAPLAWRVRIFNAYGPGEWPNSYRSVVAQFCRAALQRVPLIVHKGHSRDFVYIDDLVRTLVEIPKRWDTLPQEPTRRVCNIGGEQAVKIESLAEMICDAAGAPRGLIRLHAFETGNTKDKVPTLARAKEWLGHENTVSLEAGIQRTLAWMRERGL